MIVSRNEVEMTARRAGLGAGLPVGLAEEFGRAAAVRPDLIPDLLRALATDRQPPNLRADADGWVLGPPCPLLLVGPSVPDLLLSGAAWVRLEAADHPSLLPAYLARLETDHGRAAVTETRSGSIEIRLDEASRRRAPLRAGAVEICDAIWRPLHEAAARSLVPSDDRSRATGAGAGLNDTD